MTWEEVFFNRDNYKADSNTLEFAVPGYGKEDLEISIKNKVLTIIGDNGTDKFKRYFTVTKYFDNITASCDKGILKIMFEEQEEQSIEIVVE